MHTLRLGNCLLNIEPEHPQLLDLFRDFLVEFSADAETIAAGAYEKEQYLEQFRGALWDAYAENKCLLTLASDAMMKHSQCILHSAAVLIGGNAWLLAGPSGIGKSTQYANMKELYPDDVCIISGDNPIAAFETDGIMVYPSPWNGKENWRSMEKGKLAGIILLEQGKENVIRPVTPDEAVIPVFHAVNTYTGTEEQIHLLASLEERLISSVPVWKFRNTGDSESSKILYEHIIKEQMREAV